MKELIDSYERDHDVEALEPGVMYLELSSKFTYPSRLSVTYTGKFRDVSDNRMLLIWVFMTSVDRGLSEVEVNVQFGTEGLFLEDGVEYWIPVQKILVDYMVDELEQGDEIELFLIFLGSHKSDSGLDLVFMVNVYR